MNAGLDLIGRDLSKIVTPWDSLTVKHKAGYAKLSRLLLLNEICLEKNLTMNECKLSICNFIIFINKNM